MALTVDGSGALVLLTGTRAEIVAWMEAHKRSKLQQLVPLPLPGVATVGAVIYTAVVSTS